MATKKPKRELSSYLKMNKKKTKVRIKGVPKLLGMTGVLVQLGFPFAYLSVRYDLFTFEEAGYTLTGWGIVAVAIAMFAFGDKIKDAMKEAEANFGMTYQRSKLAITMFLLSLLVILTNFFVEAFVLLFAIIAGSTLISLPLYRKYDEVLMLKKEVQEELKRRNTEKALNQVESVIKL